MNIKIKEIIIKRPSFPRYKEDDKNMIIIVRFNSNHEWVPTFDEMQNLNSKLKECYNWNLQNDLWVKKNEK